MARVDREPISLLDDPVKFVDHLSSLKPDELSLADKRRITRQVRADYGRADELLKPIQFTLRRNPEGRPILTPTYGRVEIDGSYGEGFLKVSPEGIGRHTIRMAFYCRPDNRRFRELFIEDWSIEQADKPHPVRRGFVITARPFSLRPLKPNEMF